MCDPLTATVAAATVLKIGSTIVESKAQNKQADAVKDSALDALKIQDHELSLSEVQQRIAGGQQIEQANQDVVAATGDVNASAAARGVGGMTTDLLLNDVLRQGSAYRDSVRTQTDANIAQTERQKDAAFAEAQARINGAPKANPFATALKIGSSVLDFASYKIGNKPKGT